VSGLINLAVALFLAPRYGAVGMASARVLGEATLATMLLGITIRLQLVGLLPGAQRAMGMVRLARGLRPQPGTGKDE
jgi:hypothetical protein